MKSLLTLLFSFTISALSAQSVVKESMSFQSKILQKDIRYSVYLPDGYNTSLRMYPVVYLLNGFTGNETDWIQFGDMQHIVDEGIAQGDIPPMVIIMPDGDDRLYMNNHDNSYRYGDMFIEELMPHVEGKYRIRAEKQFRGISGLSMGGAGTLRFAMLYPELFGAAAAYSSAVGTDEEMLAGGQQGFDGYWGRALGTGLKGEARLSEHYRKNSILDIAKTADVNKLNTVRIYFDCGDDDFLAIGNASLHIEMRKRGIRHQYRVRDGAHTWDFWRTSLPIGLKFIAESFTR
ncbi:esterase family protein [Roseivirga sp. E12]|uniref:alpha/beta hydrolase n=1 Tax=Roseivirga sp. E12 TaxID=2819237 RepID=UPI001ABD3E2A|nr:alpha/beta hydrolase-fold protein [Roseivirga sp. E12]MBO3698042.1 esterase family protein [Roseivirga sp. E12]